MGQERAEHSDGGGSMFTPKFKAKAPTGSGVWTPKSQTPTPCINDYNDDYSSGKSVPPTPPPPPGQPIWTPQPSPSSGRKEFRPVRFESPTLPRRYVLQQQHSASTGVLPPWSDNEQHTATATTPSPRSVNSWTNLSSTTLGSSHFNESLPPPPPPQHLPLVAPPSTLQSGVSEKIRNIERSTSASELYQRRQEAQRPFCRPNDVIYKVKHEYTSEPETEHENPRKMAQLGRRQYDGIGPVTNDGMPIILRSEVKEPHQHEWYKRLYQTIHKQKNNDDYVISYKCPRAGRHQYSSRPNGYQSEPEPNYDSDYSVVKYRALDRRRVEPVTSITNVRNSTSSSNVHQNDKYYGSMPNPIKSGQNSYKNQPGRIENYTTGNSSVSEKEKKEWWDEVMDIFNGWLREHTIVPRIIIEFANECEAVDHFEQTKLSPHYTEGNLSRALAKETSGYTSDSNLVFRRKEAPPSSALSPVEQKQFYKSVQAGGEPPLFGFRKPAPEKPRDIAAHQVECVRITPTLTKIRVNRKDINTVKRQGETQPQLEESVSEKVKVFAKVMPSFITIGGSVTDRGPPTPPNRKSSCVKTTTTVRLDGRPTPPRISSRHEKCFQSPADPPAPEPVNKYGTITLRKHHAAPSAICRSKSTGAVSTLISNLLCSKEPCKRSTPVRVSQLQKHTRLRSLSPQRRQPRITATTIRQCSRSPVAFGRSISRERTFAEEKKRLENTLPPCRTNFEASTNILRDPSLKSPHEVKKAVRSYATCPSHLRSKSLPRLRSPKVTSVNTTMRHTMCFPQMRPTTVVHSTPTSQGKHITRVMLGGKPTPKTTKHVTKTVSTHSLARTSSTFSLESTSTTRHVTPKRKAPITITSKPTISRVKSMSAVASKPKRVAPVKRPVNTLQSSRSESNVGRNSINVTAGSKVRVTKPQAPIGGVRASSSASLVALNGAGGETELKTTHWHDYDMHDGGYKSLVSQHVSHVDQCKCSSPHLTEELYKSDEEHGSEFGDAHYVDDLVWQYERQSKRDQPPRAKSPVAPVVEPIAVPVQAVHTESTPISERKFSPTREVRIPPSTVRNLRSPSRRRIDSCRQNTQRGAGPIDTSRVIRASSLSSADDRSRRGLYLCGELAHSATSLTHYERHSPTCRYRNNSERFTDLNRFYSTLERVGQLERATSLTNFKPIRKDSELLDFDEWRKVRLHERAERELHYLVGRLKQDQREKDLLFRPKDVDDVKWRRERDYGLHAKKKSVEDLREGFERQQLFSDCQRRFAERGDQYQRGANLRRNTVANLASNLEEKLHQDSDSCSLQHRVPEESERNAEAAPTSLHLSSSVVSTLSKDQIRKISQQLNDIYSSKPRVSLPDEEEYVVTVERESRPSAAAYALKVRCNSTISKEELLGPVLRKRDLQAGSVNVKDKTPQMEEQERKRHAEEPKIKSVREGSPIVLARETRGAVAAKNADVKQRKQCEQPATPHSITLEATSKKKASDKDTPIKLRPAPLPPPPPQASISKKIQYFEERPLEEPPKTIYHAREDSSPDEQEIMRLIEENMRTRAENRRTMQQHKELSSSLTDLKGMFGERQPPRVNFHERSDEETPTPAPPECERPQEDHDVEVSHTAYDLDLELSPGASMELYDASYYRSRSLSPQSQGSSSYLHRVHTGEVQKMRERFESIGSQQEQQPKLHRTNPFFGVSSLRKARSDTELRNTLSSASKDALDDASKNDMSAAKLSDAEHGDVCSLARQFEQQNRSLSSATTTTKASAAGTRGRPHKRRIISPTRLGNRLMPHIDIISKTAALKREVRRKVARTPTPPPRSRSSSAGGETGSGAGAVESLRSHYERADSPRPPTFVSSPDLRANVSEHLSANWIAHRFPSPTHNACSVVKVPPSNASTAQRRKKPSQRLRRRANSASPPRPPKSVQHQACSAMTASLKPRYGDIFANQKFDPKIHQPKARYVPDGAEPNTKTTRCRRSGLPSSYDILRKSVAVTFQDFAPSQPMRPAPLDQHGRPAAEVPNRYFESDVNIHFKAPIRHEYKPPMPEEELAYRQAEQMQKLYQEERRRKYLQELQDMNSRRHTDNFTPTQKSPIPLNRYDDFHADMAPKSPNIPNYRKTAAKALFNFQGQSARELTFRKGDIIYIRRQIDKNWYEGEHNASIGLLPVNYVEVVNKQQPPQQQPGKKPSEGQARAKYNFQAQSGVELSLNKGELVTLTRRVDENWFEGKIANRKGIFPVTYVEVLTDIGANDQYELHPTRTVTTETHSSSNYRPTLDALRTNINNEFNLLTQNGQQPPNGILKETRTVHKTDVLHVDTSSEPLTYRALYKYRPQNSDELELLEGDMVHVLEKCDDGWFVGTSQRTGCFGTFPGNYVERVV